MTGVSVLHTTKSVVTTIIIIDTVCSPERLLAFYSTYCLTLLLSR